MMSTNQTAHLSGQTIDAIVAALFSRIVQANTALRTAAGNERCSGAPWAANRTEGLSALRDVLTYAETHYLEWPGAADSTCDLAASFFHEGG